MSWQKERWDRLCFGDTLGNTRVCLYIDVFDPGEAGNQDAGENGDSFSRGILNKQGGQDITHKEGLALGAKTVHLLKRIV